MTYSGIDVLVRLDDPQAAEFREVEVPEPRDGEALLRVQRFALTANNVTYAAAGYELGYWKFFPGPEGWGRVPVWGFAEVVASASDSAAVGDRLYGYWPMSTFATIAPTGRRGSRLIDTTEHRRDLPALYNAYLPAGTENAQREEVECLLRPLFGTAWLIADALAHEGYRGASSVLISSASAKTAAATAWCLSTLPDRPRIIGLTSSRNAEYVAGLDGYDEVLTYDDFATAPVATPVTFVDIAGSAAIRRSVHERFGPELVWSMIVGATHWQDPAGFTGQADLPGPTPEMFFAPSQLELRTRELGKQALFEAMGSAQTAFIEVFAESAQLVRVTSPAAVVDAWTGLAGGTSLGAASIVAAW
ncbi:DUF2855 family protein [Antrihabitans sp. YC2-6]|uniref:DUF2855 family protein n=1 Tax=Antrihabitans sp. YC2-6 TaxID=2799498 RepID=UPI0018F55C25|nr:DUF2855 family protein [Antrihabitans sp. YC2-6]MBJ8346126.1 DUF2855 family protein [Antrihabitans sp. YC2-6]